MKLRNKKKLLGYSLLFLLSYCAQEVHASELGLLDRFNADLADEVQDSLEEPVASSSNDGVQNSLLGNLVGLPENITITFDKENDEEDKESLEVPKKVYAHMQMLSQFVATVEIDQEKPSIPLQERLAPLSGVALLKNLIVNVLDDKTNDESNYTENPSNADFAQNKAVVKKHLNDLVDKIDNPTSCKKAQLLADAYKAANFLNVQLLKKAEESEESSDAVLLELIANKASENLAQCKDGFDFAVGHTGLEEQLKIELTKRYHHPRVEVHKFMVNDFISHVQLSNDRTTLLICVDSTRTTIRKLQDSGIYELFLVVNGFARLSANGAYLVICPTEQDKAIVSKLQDNGTYTPMFTVTKYAANGHQKNIYRALLSADGTVLVTHSSDKVIVHKLQDGAYEFLLAVTRGDSKGHQEEINSARLTDNDTVLVTRSHDKPIHRYLKIYGIQPSPSMKFVAEFNWDNRPVFIFQQEFEEEIINALSLKQIQQAVYAQEHHQDYPKIDITPVSYGKISTVNVEFFEDQKQKLVKKDEGMAIKRYKKSNEEKPVASSSNN